MVKLVLASNSKQRQEILNMIGLKYDVVPSLIEEKSKQILPDKYVEELSLNKAISVSKQLKEKAIIVAADTIIYCNNKIYEKPKNDKQVYSNLKELSGKINQAYTGMTIIDLYQNKTISCSTVTDIKFKDIEDSEIKWYIENEEKKFKCCGYTPLGIAAVFIEYVNGDYNNLLGLSPSVILSNLKALGYSIIDFEFSKNSN